jgi:hypothetical protein
MLTFYQHCGEGSGLSSKHKDADGGWHIEEKALMANGLWLVAYRESWRWFKRSMVQSFKDDTLKTVPDVLIVAVVQ